jgi:superfamily II DNA/RNA helicase
MAIYKEFCEAKKGVLMATDLAGRGLGKSERSDDKLQKYKLSC